MPIFELLAAVVFSFSPTAHSASSSVYVFLSFVASLCLCICSYSYSNSVFAFFCGLFKSSSFMVLRFFILSYSSFDIHLFIPFMFVADSLLLPLLFPIIAFASLSSIFSRLWRLFIPS